MFLIRLDDCRERLLVPPLIPQCGSFGIPPTYYHLPGQERTMVG